MSKIIVGGEVMWRDRWGIAAPKMATVASIEWFDGGKNMKTADGVSKTEIEESEKDFCMFTLTNGKWAYGNQIDAIK